MENIKQDKWAETVKDIFMSKDFLDFVNKTVQVWKEVQDRRIKIEEKRIDNDFQKLGSWESVTRLFLWFKFILSFVVLIGFGFALKYELLPTAAIIPLLAGIIASLFVVPKKE